MQLVLIVQKFEYLAHLAWKCLFTPQAGVFGEIDSVNGRDIDMHLTNALVDISDRSDVSL